MDKMEKIKELILTQPTEADLYRLAIEYKPEKEDKKKLLAQIKTGKDFEIKIPIWSMEF